MSEKKKTVKRADAVPHTQASPEKLEAAKAELAKMIEGVQNGEKLLAELSLEFNRCGSRPSPRRSPRCPPGPGPSVKKTRR